MTAIAKASGGVVRPAKPGEEAVGHAWKWHNYDNASLETPYTAISNKSVTFELYKVKFEPIVFDPPAGANYWFDGEWFWRYHNDQGDTSLMTPKERIESLTIQEIVADKKVMKYLGLL